jgi:hypothetical protein
MSFDSDRAASEQHQDEDVGIASEQPMVDWGERVHTRDLRLLQEEDEIVPGKREEHARQLGSVQRIPQGDLEGGSTIGGARSLGMASRRQAA